MIIGRSGRRIKEGEEGEMKLKLKQILGQLGAACKFRRLVAYLLIESENFILITHDIGKSQR